jgi:peptidoglycan/LPS O-acetylase OafA/YrhL
MILVAYIHGYNLNLFIAGETEKPIADWLRFLENAVSDGFCRVAVPMFFAISGYLASAKIMVFSPDIHREMLKKRLVSLVVPYLFVSLLGILLVVVLLLLPWSKPYFNNFSLSSPFSHWLKIWIVSPVPFQLWFLRFLWFYFLMYPLLYFGVKYGKWLFMIFMLWFWSDFLIQYRMNMQKLEVEGMVFFSIGIFLAVHRKPIGYRIRPIVFFIAFALWMVWIGWRTGLLIQPEKDHYAVHYHILGITFSGFFLFWFGYDFLPQSLRNSTWLKINAPYSIGVFLLHEPALTILKKLIIKAMGMNDLSLFISFLAAPAIAFMAALFLAKEIHRTIPAFYGLLTGNRAPRETNN